MSVKMQGQGWWECTITWAAADALQHHSLLHIGLSTAPAKLDGDDGPARTWPASFLKQMVATSKFLVFGGMFGAAR